VTRPYALIILPRARKSIERLDRTVRARIQAALELLSEHPRPPRSTPLVGETDVYRVRVGDYRILYSVQDEIRIIEIRKVAHRREAYRT
jgi:mRNA interferase RelE/StbE